MDLPVNPPVAPMLARSVKTMPLPGRTEDGFLYEPKWDGFRCLVFRDGDEVELTSRNERPMTRYFPEVVEGVKESLPPRCVLDGELIVAMEGRLEFERLQERIHPADSRVRRLAAETPASFVAFDVLALDEQSLMDHPMSERRSRLESALAAAGPPVHITPATRDHDTAQAWFGQFEGAGLDGVVAKPLSSTYQPGVRAMYKIKHERTADVVVAGYRLHKTSKPERPLLGSLLLGLYDPRGGLQHVGVSAAFAAARRAELFDELAPLEVPVAEHPWADWASADDDGDGKRRPGAESRWSAGKDLSWTPLDPVLVCEVGYDHMEGTRFRHTAQFKRWRPDREPASCTYDQLEEPVSYDLGEILGP
ncbi:MAG: ATP-dependent DNA ligase [Nocardioidaceae bacterium]